MAYLDVNHWKSTFKVMLKSELSITLAIMLGSAGIVGWMVWLEKYPRKSLNPRLFPTTLVLIVAGLVALLAFFHLTDLLRPFILH